MSSTGASASERTVEFVLDQGLFPGKLGGIAHGDERAAVALRSVFAGRDLSRKGAERRIFTTLRTAPVSRMGNLDPGLLTGRMR